MVPLRHGDVGAFLLLRDAWHARRVHGEPIGLLDDKTTNLQYGAIQAFVYAFTFLGGVFADKILGFQKSLFWGVC